MKIMNVKSHKVGEVPVIELTGEFDISTAQEVERELLRLEEDQPPTMVVDLRPLTFIDSTGLRTILAADSRCRAFGGRLVLVQGPPAVHRVFRIALLDQRLEFTEEPEALLRNDGGGR